MKLVTVELTVEQLDWIKDVIGTDVETAQDMIGNGAVEEEWFERELIGKDILKVLGEV